MLPDFKKIKDLYAWFENEIFQMYKENNDFSKWVDPYQLGFNFIEIFSPIEKITWDALRYFGKAPFYPQYPVGKYFLDFGNPLIKVGIECDGKEFHQDKEKDLLRDTELKKLGWTIYRISGSDCNKNIPDFNYTENYDSLKYHHNFSDHFSQTIDGLIKAIHLFYFDRNPSENNEDMLEAALECLKSRVSLYSLDYENQLTIFSNNFYEAQFNREPEY